MSGALLSVEGLRVAFDRPVVRGVSFDVYPGSVTALVGESGSGKTVSCLSALGLQPPGAEVAGLSRFRGRDLSGLGPAELRSLRAGGVGFVFQDPRKYLDPSMRVGEQLARAIRFGKGSPRATAANMALALLASVGLDAERAYAAYPHELSGGMCQRAFIALAISCGPALLVADEPTTALDASVQRSVLDLLLGLVRERGMGMVLVTHDLRAVAYAADRVYVMLAGLVMESGTKEALITNPAHPYTRLLLDSLPGEDFVARKASRDAARSAETAIRGFLSGCPFADRCPMAESECRVGVPPLVSGPGGSALRCRKGGIR